MARSPTWLPCFALAAASIAATGCGTPSFGATAEPLGIVPQSATIQGRDGGQSALAFGRSVWTFGDTVLNIPDAEGVNWHQNSWSYTDDLVAGDDISGLTEPTDSAGAPTYFIAPTADEAAYNTAHYGSSCAETPCGARWAAWPGAPLWDATQGRAIVFYGLVHAAPGDFNFYGVGEGLAVWSDFDTSPQRPVVSPGAEHPTLLFGQGDPPWGDGALIEGDQLYAFACETDTGGMSPPCSLARVPSAQALDRQAWTFWDGSDWSASMSERATLFSGASTITVEFNAYLGAYTAVYAETMSNTVVIRTAPALTGPWSDPEILFTADKPAGNAYDAASHPEYEEQNGKVLYFTFSRSNGQGWFGAEFALVRVTLP
jgi:Domain of unknown function (DUF4185)